MNRSAYTKIFASEYASPCTSKERGSVQGEASVQSYNPATQEHNRNIHLAERLQISTNLMKHSQRKKYALDAMKPKEKSWFRRQPVCDQVMIVLVPLSILALAIHIAKFAF